jgi:hypothetical protein
MEVVRSRGLTSRLLFGVPAAFGFINPSKGIIFKAAGVFPTSFRVYVYAVITGA